MECSCVFKIAQDVRVRKEDFGLLVISKSAPALALNPDLKHVWELIDGIRSVDEVSNVISNEYAGENIRNKVVEVFDKLISLNLIEAVEK